MERRYFDDLEAMSLAAAGLVAARARAGSGRFGLVLAGGTTPERTYELLAAQAKVPWEAVDVFFGDERCVGPDHPASNYGLAWRALLSRVDLPRANVHAMVCRGDARAAAEAHEAELAALFKGLPVFDLVLLGLGEDGHTASLFPGRTELEETRRWVVPVDGRRARPPVDRISLTLPVLNAAREVLFLVAGRAKLDLAERMAADPRGAAAGLPAARVRPSGPLWWFLSP